MLVLFRDENYDATIGKISRVIKYVDNENFMKVVDKSEEESFILVDISDSVFAKIMQLSEQFVERGKEHFDEHHAFQPMEITIIDTSHSEKYFSNRELYVPYEHNVECDVCSYDVFPVHISYALRLCTTADIAFVAALIKRMYYI